MTFRIGWRRIFALGFAACLALTLAFGAGTVTGALVMEEYLRSGYKTAVEKLDAARISLAATELVLKQELAKAAPRHGAKRRNAIGGGD